MLKEIVEKYLRLFPGDRPKLKLLLEQLDREKRLDNRRNFKGHIAGDAIIISPDFQKILYVYHLRADRWQQPGGHLDQGEKGPWLTAKREAYEETGVQLDKVVGPIKTDLRLPLHVVTGPVPPSKAKKEPSHWHHDFRYGYIAKSEKLGKIQDRGIAEAKWFKLSEAVKIKDSGHEVLTSINRMLELLQ